MSMERDALLAEEARAWEEFAERLAEVAPERLEEPTVTPEGWSVKDVVVHVGGWLRECAEVLDAMVDGTWGNAAEEPETPERIERVNAGHLELARTMTPAEAAASMAGARDRARRAMSILPELTPGAWSWFEESGPLHYAKHGHDLTAWLAGVTSDPRVGPLLQTEAEDWVGFRGMLEAVAPATVLGDPPGWTAHDVTFHVALWLESSAADLEANRGWAHDDDPGELELVDAMNARWLEEGRGLAPDVVRARLDRARARLRAAVAALPAPSQEALGWFEANCQEHYAEHLPSLRSAARLSGRVSEAE